MAWKQGISIDEKSMRILVVEDDKRIADFIKKGLEQEGFVVSLAHDGVEGYAAAKYHEFDLIVIDVMMPEMDGIAVLQKLRQNKDETPVLVLSAKGTVDDRIKGLRAGGDDYMVKPFSFAELVARIDALVRRSRLNHKSEPSAIMTIGEIVMNHERHEAHVNGHELNLQPKEFILLGYLMRNRGRVISKTMILEYVWGYNFDPQTNVVEAKVSRLRSKIMEHSDKSWIHTIRGLGYKFEEKG